MRRYQVYLNPHSVSILDELEQLTAISRSKLIRELIDRFADQVGKVLAAKGVKPPQYKYFDKLVGSIRLRRKTPTNFALNEDDIYLRD